VALRNSLTLRRKFRGWHSRNSLTLVQKIRLRTQDREDVLWVPPSIILDKYEAFSCVPPSTLLEDIEAVS
jgi:hypothetical protein